MKKNTKAILALCFFLIIAGLLLRNASDTSAPASTVHHTQSQSIERLTQQQTVVNYLVKHQKLPDYYLTKKQARERGWNTRDGNLCEILPKHAIGGDRFGNREKVLPNKSGRQWYEADVNYQCGHRGADRLLYSNDGMIFITRDHYKSVTRVK